MSSLPPLVTPNGELSATERERYSRQTVLPEFGDEGQRRLKNAKVLVVGAGGLGSPVLLYLAAAGVGTLGVVDFDEVDHSNLQRQVLHGQADVGRPKTISARDRIADLDPSARVEPIQERLTPANATELFRRYDLVVDGSDNFATRYLVNDAAAAAGKPYVWGSIHRFAGQVAVFWADAPAGRGLDYRDLYPEPPAEGAVPNCAEGGVLGAVCGVVGSMMAAEAVKLITGVGEALLGALLLYDALTGRTRTIAVRRDPARTVRPPVVVGAPTPVLALRPEELADLLSGEHPPTLVDVRDESEFAQGHIEGAWHIPLDRIGSAAQSGELPVDRLVVVYCTLGPRSAHAAKVLLAAGLPRVGELRGGLFAWNARSAR